METTANVARTQEVSLEARRSRPTDLSFRPSTPPMSPGTDRLSVLSATATDLSDFSPSPTASIGSVRIATLTSIPCRTAHRRRSAGMASVCSEDGCTSNAIPIREGPVLDAEDAGAMRTDGSDGVESARSENPAPVARVLSSAPWLDPAGDENAPPLAVIPSRRKGLTPSRSLDLLGKFRPTCDHEDGQGRISRSGQLGSDTSSKYTSSSHRRSASAAPLSRMTTNAPLGAPRPVTPFVLEPEESGGIRQSPAARSSGFQSLWSRPAIESIPDVGAAGLQAYAQKRADLDLSDYLERGPRNVRQPTLLPSGFTLPAAVEVPPPEIPSPEAAPAGTLLFARRGITASASKMSLAFSASSSSPATPSPITPAGLAGQDSYFTAVPGAPSTGSFPGGFGHRLISLKEARQRETERSAAARRKAASTPPPESSLETGERGGDQPARSGAKGEPLSSRRGEPVLDGLKITGTRIVTDAQPAMIKPKRSGFLRRMMGGGGGSSSNSHADKASTSPDSSRPSMSPSVSTLCLSPTMSVPAAAARATDLAGPGGPWSALVANGREASSQPRISIQGTPERQDGMDAILQLSTSTSPTLSLRPNSTVLSAGLPADFLADAMLAPTPLSSTSPTWSWSHPSSPTLSLSPPPDASMFGALDPVTPRTRSTASPTSSLRASASAPDGAASHRAGGVYHEPFGPTPTGTVPLEHFVALQDEFDRARSAWSAREQELEAQIRQLTTCLAARDARPQPEGVRRGLP